MHRRAKNHNRNYQKPDWEVERENAEREELENTKKRLERTEENFPSLGGGGAFKPTAAWTSKKFSELATAWNREEEERKAAEERLKKKEERTSDTVGFVMPQFNPSHTFVEPEDETPVEEPVAAPQVETEDDDSGWTRVDSTLKNKARKKRQVQRVEERLARMDEGELSESDSNNEEEDDTCWNDVPEAHETCWDDRNAH